MSRVTSPERSSSVLRIAPRTRTPLLPRELFDGRELLFFLTQRDVKIRYKQTVLGVLWALLQPLLTMLVFAVFFGRLAKVPSDGVPYSVFALCGLVPWTFFANTLQSTALSLVNNGNLLSKIYFPRVAVPLAAVGAGLVDLAVSGVVLVGFSAFRGLVVGPRLLLVPVLVLLAVMTLVGAGCWFAALNVAFRDIRYTTPFLVQLWFFLTPVVYPSSLLSSAWQTVYALNPMVAVVEGFRWALLGTDAPMGRLLLASGISATLLLLAGLYAFHRREPTFADVV